MDKSYVTMEQNVCVVCTRKFDTGAILLDRRMRNVFEKETATGWGMCAECKQFAADGFVQLVECKGDHEGTMKPGDADRTGRICRLKKDAFERVFQQPAPKGGCMFIAPGIIEKLEAMVAGDARPVLEQVGAP